MDGRRRLALYALVADVALAAGSYVFAMIVFDWYHHYEVHLLTQPLDWGIVITVLVIVATFFKLGLYKAEVFVSRPLHLATLLKGVVIALVITALVAFTLKAAIVTESRLTVFTAFGVFFAAAAVARICLLDGAYRADVRRRPGGTLVIGASLDSSVIVSRCRELRGFAPVRSLEPLDRRRNGHDAEPRLLEALAAADPAPRQVFLDAASLGHKAIFDLIEAARARGAEVYVTGRLVGPLDTTRLLIHLFEMPVMHVRGSAATRERPPVGKRAFDLVVSAVALIVLAPFFAVIALLIKRDSPGPVFYRQTRIGLAGRPFEFVKFRSMAVDNDASQHEDAVRRFIAGGAEGAGLDATDEYGRPVYKLSDDARVTRVGHYLRKYSLDELPQLWNVLRGDMSMIGPRPALAYEVDAYKPWHRRRLGVAPGISGLWQVAGRSRVDFDEMVFQDVIYAYNESVLTDVSICLRTVPAVLMGRGAV